MADIRIVNLLKVFGTLHAVDNLNYTFADGKVTCLLGPSGCGKTTLLRMIAGLETVTDGDIYFGDREITSLPTRDRNIGMVFQYPVVYKGLTVEQNIALPLREAKLAAAEIEERVNEAIDLLDAELGLLSSESSVQAVMGEQALAKRKKKLRYAKVPLFWRSFAYFLYRYFIKLGFLDGKEGFLWHFLQGWWYRTLVDAKIYEIKKACGTDKGKIINYIKTNYGIDCRNI